MTITVLVTYRIFGATMELGLTPEQRRRRIDHAISYEVIELPNEPEDFSQYLNDCISQSGIDYATMMELGMIDCIIYDNLQYQIDKPKLEKENQNACYHS